MSFTNDTYGGLLPVGDHPGNVRILFSCIPSEGHFRPLLPLARALRARGHEIAFAAASEWEPRAAAEGFSLLAAGISEHEARAQLREAFEEISALPPEERRA